MNYLLNININSEISSADIVDFLKSEIHFKEICQKILFQRIINRKAALYGVDVTAEEIQQEAERQRRERGLERASDTMIWLKYQLIDTSDWETGIRNYLLAQKLAEAMFSAEADSFFAQHRLELEQIVLYHIVVNNKKLAQEIYYQIEEAEISFFDAANTYDIDENRRQKCGYEGRVYRWELNPDIAGLLFSSQLQQLTGPFKIIDKYHLFMVEDFIPAELTKQRYTEIISSMFQKWLNTELDCILSA
ncbi:MAG: peptidylprolyl isomerase [Mastigocoleus sp.]